MAGESGEKETSRRKEINKVNYHGKNKFLTAIEKGETGTVMAMLEQGADVHFRTQPRSPFSAFVLEIPYAIDSTPLHVAALLGHEKIVDLLLKHGASVNDKNQAGQTPLDCALLSHAYYETEMTKKPTIGTYLSKIFNGTPAKREGFEKIIRDLLSHGAKPALFSLPEKFNGPVTGQSLSNPPPLP